VPLTDEQRAEISPEPLQVEENGDGTLTIYGSAVVAAAASGPDDDPQEPDEQ
jgi:hypothetical protein